MIDFIFDLFLQMVWKIGARGPQGLRSECPNRKYHWCRLRKTLSVGDDPKGPQTARTKQGEQKIKTTNHGEDPVSIASNVCSSEAGSLGPQHLHPRIWTRDSDNSSVSLRVKGNKNLRSDARNNGGFPYAIHRVILGFNPASWPLERTRPASPRGLIAVLATNASCS
jgi:hypothetical protein